MHVAVLRGSIRRRRSADRSNDGSQESTAPTPLILGDDNRWNHLHKAACRLLLSHKGCGGRCNTLGGDVSNPPTTLMDWSLFTPWTTSTHSCRGIAIPPLQRACGNPFPKSLRKEDQHRYKMGDNCPIEGDFGFFFLDPWLSPRHHLDLAVDSSSYSRVTIHCCTSRVIAVQYKKAGVGVLPPREGPKPR
jgi:hypothetical protein